MPFMNDDKRFIKPAALRDFRLQAKEMGWPDEYTAVQIGMVKTGVLDSRLHDSCVLLLDNMCTEEEYEQLFYDGLIEAMRPLYDIVVKGAQSRV